MQQMPPTKVDTARHRQKQLFIEIISLMNLTIPLKYGEQPARMSLCACKLASSTWIKINEFYNLRTLIVHVCTLFSDTLSY